MNLQRIDGHTIDLDLLTNSGTIVDLGCRGFVFANYFKNPAWSSVFLGKPKKFIKTFCLPITPIIMIIKSMIIFKFCISRLD